MDSRMEIPWALVAILAQYDWGNTVSLTVLGGPTWATTSRLEVLAVLSKLGYEPSLGK
jgi:hypothetical protein